MQGRAPGSVKSVTMLSTMQVAESSSALFGAFAFDALHMGVRAVALLMASIAAVSCCAWILYAWCQWPKQIKRGSHHDNAESASLLDEEQQGLLSSDR